MEKIVYTTMIDCSVEELYQFHLDSNNIAKITPQNIKVELLNDDSSTYEGKIVKIKTSKFFIPTYWEVKIEKLQEPNILIDVAQKSPFKYWKHQHIFTKIGDMCVLKDIVEYEIPFGIFGRALSSFIKNDINQMFTYRHYQTKRILEKITDEDKFC